MRGQGCQYVLSLWFKVLSLFCKISDLVCLFIARVKLLLMLICFTSCFSLRRHFLGQLFGFMSFFWLLTWLLCIFHLSHQVWCTLDMFLECFFSNPYHRNKKSTNMTCLQPWPVPMLEHKPGKDPFMFVCFEFLVKFPAPLLFLIKSVKRFLFKCLPCYFLGVPLEF